ncbi:MAG: redox-regulated ATPase YchF [Patescibacteria group bacterium]|nr:redox-regulated ATPase YchF [Patescibacteria group bacterium]
MLSIGIVGLPNVGKSTIFNLLAGKKQADAQNFPFCTIEPNEAVINVPDERLDKIAKIANSQRIVQTAIKFVDIAGLVRGASQGEGLGNQFLSHIRECDAILQVVRFFNDENVIHVEGSVNPDRDVATIITELCLADLASLQKQMEKLEKRARAQDKEAKRALELGQAIKLILENGHPASEVFTDSKPISAHEEDRKIIESFFLLTSKPFFYVANVSENDVGKDFQIDGQDAIAISAKFEEELIDLDADSQKEFLADAGITESGLDKIIRTGYAKLDLISFLTAGEKESRAWTIKNGFKAPQAAGVIHTDFEKKFIAADVVSYENFVVNNGWVGAREKGLVRSEGKEYLVKDGDVMIFKHG